MKGTTNNNQDQDRTLQSSAIEPTGKIQVAETKFEQLRVAGDDRICHHSEQLKQAIEQLSQATAVIEKQKSQIARFDVLLQQWELDMSTVRQEVGLEMGKKAGWRKRQLEGREELGAKRQRPC